MAADFLDRLKRRMRAGESIEMANVSVVDQFRQMAADTHNRRRMEAQVDAQLRCKHGECYEPPVEDDEPMEIYMNNVITDAKTLKHVADAEAGRPVGGRLPWILGMLGTAGLAAALTAYMMDDRDTDTQNTLRPNNPQQIVPADQP